MKKIGLLIPSALCAAVPVVCVTACSTTTGIGAPDVTLDAGQNKTVTIGPDKTFSFNFTLSKDLPAGITLQEVYFSSGVQREYQWAFIVNEHPTITNKKVTVEFTTEGTSGFDQHPQMKGKMVFEFTNGKTQEHKDIEGFVFNYQA